jgi:hypothetical protein
MAREQLGAELHELLAALVDLHPGVGGLGHPVRTTLR